MIEHRWISGLLIALLVLTSHSMGMVRGAAAATDQVVLCTGNGAVAIYIDADGNPTAAPHLCPDCALNVPVDLHTPDLAWTYPLSRTGYEALEDRYPVPQVKRKTPRNRAPPVEI